MSYNPQTTSQGLNRVYGGKFNGGQFNPEDYSALGENKRALPDFRCLPRVYNPSGRTTKPIYFGCMTDYIGQRRGFRANSCMEYPCRCE